MRRATACCLGLLLGLSPAGPARGQDSLAVLFIGNSHTYVNDLPALVEGLAAAAGRPLATGRSLIGGYTLDQHATNPTTRALWLQEQAAAQLPLPPLVEQPFRPRRHLLGARPNPFNPGCTLALDLAADGSHLEIRDAGGRLVSRRELDHLRPGPHQLFLDGAAWPSGRFWALLVRDDQAREAIPLTLLR
ncbi:MAG: hypothetical protein Q8O14_07120 [bacterium]|jgi:hypothetical protein|nr:hypothetical protein [bacterium]